MAGRRKKRKIIKKPVVAENCTFCKSGVNPDYKDYKVLKKYLSERAKILGKDRTGVCSKHQRALTTEIKRARQIGVLPFVPAI